jgi:transketolase
VSFMENELKWHHGVPNPEQYAIAMEELDSVIAEL